MKRNLAVAPAGAGVFSEQEEEFFRAGAALESASAFVESFDDLDAGYTPQSFWSRLTTKRPVRAATEPPVPAIPVRKTRVATAPIAVEADDDEDEWEWQIAIARARADIPDELTP
jgi:hypothetical protein